MSSVYNCAGNYFGVKKKIGALYDRKYKRAARSVNALAKITLLSLDPDRYL